MLDSRKNKDIENFEEVFAIIKEYIKNHPGGFYLQDHVYEEVQKVHDEVSKLLRKVIGISVLITKESTGFKLQK